MKGLTRACTEWKVQLGASGATAAAGEKKRQRGSYYPKENPGSKGVNSQDAQTCRQLLIQGYSIFACEISVCLFIYLLL